MPATAPTSAQTCATCNDATTLLVDGSFCGLRNLGTAHAGHVDHVWG
ncbi:MAG TPA: hypothetical protein VIY51_18235 [Xanthobacteraceae bacterium]